MKIKIIAGYSLIIGISILGMWGLILTTEEVPEGPLELTFHLISEFLMALAVLVAGILILKKHNLGRGLGLAAHGMVVYSVLNAAGYYAERGETVLPLLFIVLMGASLWCIILLMNKKLN